MERCNKANHIAYKRVCQIINSIADVQIENGIQMGFRTAHYLDCLLRAELGKYSVRALMRLALYVQKITFCCGSEDHSWTAVGLRGSVVWSFFFLLLHIHRWIYTINMMTYVCCDSILDIQLILAGLISNYLATSAFVYFRDLKYY